VRSSQKFQLQMAGFGMAWATRGYASKGSSQLLQTMLLDDALGRDGAGKASTRRGQIEALLVSCRRCSWSVLSSLRALTGQGSLLGTQ